MSKLAISNSSFTPMKIVENRYFNAALILMLFSAIIHTVVIFFLAAASADFHVLNYFNIVSLDRFLPNFPSTLVSDIAATAFAVLLYAVILIVNKDAS